MKNIQDLQIEDYLRILISRWHWIVFPAIAFGVATFFAVKMLPDIYVSETLILVEPQKIPQEYVRATTVTPIEGRLSTITQQIMSRTRLEKIILDNNLYAEQRKKSAMEDVVEGMRKQISLKVTRADAFSLSYQARDAATAQKVTSQIANLYIEENLKTREEQTEGVSQFLESQLADTKEKLASLEKQITDFKMRNMGSLPEQEQSNLQVLNRLQQQLQASIDSTSRLEEQRNIQQRLLADMKTLNRQALARGSANLGLTGIAAPAVLPPSDLELKKAQLNDLLRKYTEEHPDVRKLRAEIAALEKNASNASGQTTSSVPSTATTSANDGANASAEFELAQVRSHIDTLTRQIEQGSKEQDGIRKEIASYQGRVDAVPRIEQMQQDILRDYDITKQHYQSLLAKENDAEMATDLEKRQKGEQFRIIDPASYPQKPAKPNRLLLDWAGFGFGFGLSIGIVLLLELLDDSFHSDTELARLTGLPVLVSIPVIPESDMVQMVKRHFWNRIQRTG